jgi:beta-lactamase class A
LDYLKRMRVIKLFLCFAPFAAQPALAQVQAPDSWARPTAPKAGLEQLGQRLAATALDNPGQYGIAAMDLSTGRSVSFNGATAFPMASTVKVAVAATYLSEVDAGRRSLADPIAGTTAEALMNRMITHSDNVATDLLIAALGGPVTIDAWIHARNLSGIRVDRTIAQLLAAKRDLHDVRDSSTPEAMIALLRAIDTGQALKPESRLVLLDMMHRCATGRNRIRALLPADVRVEHKTGTLNGFSGDVAFLTLPDGRRIAMAMFARGGENRPGVIATLARAIYDAYAAEPSAATASVETAGGSMSSRR